jgi:hypothetical protein
MVEVAPATAVLLAAVLASVLRIMLVLNGTVGRGSVKFSQHTRIYSDHQSELSYSVDPKSSDVRL